MNPKNNERISAGANTPTRPVVDHSSLQGLVPNEESNLRQITFTENGKTVTRIVSDPQKDGK